MGREVLLIACVLAVCTTAYVDESSTNAVTNPAKGRVLLTALPLRGHLLALQALAASLSNRGYAVTVVGFDDAPVAPNPKLQFQSLGPIPAGFDPYTSSLAEVATLHRTMYQKLATGPNRPSYDVWVVDGHALGALAAAEDTGVRLVILCSSMPSEFMHTVQKFRLDAQVRKWLVIVYSATAFDTRWRKDHYPPTFNYVGYDPPRVSQEMPVRLKEWLSVDRVERATLRAMPVVFVNLGTVDESVDVKDIAMLIQAFGDLPTIWSLSEQQADYFSGKDLPESAYFIVGTSESLQTAILAQPSVSVYVNHCSMEDVISSIMSSVPVLCVPFSGEQIAIADRVAELGVGRAFEPLGSQVDEDRLDRRTTGRRLGTTVFASKIVEQVRSTSVWLASNAQVRRDVGQLNRVLREGGGSGRAAQLVEQSLAHMGKVPLEGKGSFDARIPLGHEL